MKPQALGYFGFTYLGFTVNSVTSPSAPIFLAGPPFAATETAPALPDKIVICCLPDQDCRVPLGNTASAFTTPSTVTCTQESPVNCISTLTGALGSAAEGLRVGLAIGLREESGVLDGTGITEGVTKGEAGTEAVTAGETRSEGEPAGDGGLIELRGRVGCLGRTRAESED